MLIICIIINCKLYGGIYGLQINKSKKIKRQKKISQIALSMKIGVSQEIISQYELGTSLPTVTNLIKLADYFNCSLEYLLGMTNNPSRTSNLNKSELEKNTLFEKYNSLNKENKKLFDEYLAFLITKNNKNNKK